MWLSVSVLCLAVVLCGGKQVTLPDLGTLDGTTTLSAWTNRTIYQYQGIPYAEPPTGSRRFKSPDRRGIPRLAQGHHGHRTLHEDREDARCARQLHRRVHHRIKGGSNSATIFRGDLDLVSINTCSRSGRARFMILRPGQIEKCLWPEESTPTLEFYLQFYPLWVARRLVRHRYLRATLRICRNSYPWFLIVDVIITTIYVSVNSYQQWEKKIIVVENASLQFEMVFSFATLVVFMKKERIQIWTNVVGSLSESIDENEFRNMFVETGMEWFCHNSIHFMPVGTAVVVFLAVVCHVVVDLIPAKTLIFRGSFPYNVAASPAYELTLLSQALHKTLLAITLTSVLAITVFMFNHIGVYFKILGEMLKNIRITSINKIRKQMRYAGRKMLAGSDNYCMNVKSKTLKESKLKPVCSIPVEHAHVSNRKPASYTRNATRIDNLASRQSLLQDGRMATRKQFDKSIEYWQRKPKTKIPIIISENKHPNNNIIMKYIDELYEEIPSIELDVIMQKQLKKITKLHQTLMSSTLDIGPTFNFLVWVLYSSTILAATGITLYVANAESFGMKEFFLLLTITGQPVVFGFFSYLANYIYDKSKCFNDAAYTCDWVSASQAFKRNLLTILIRANRELQVLNPPGLYPLSMELVGQVSIRAYKMINSLGSLLK